MSTAEMLSLMSYILFLLAGICCALAVFFWIRYKIPIIIGDLSGSTARKSIAKMREDNEKSGKKEYRSSTENLKRGKLTDIMKESGKLAKQTNYNQADMEHAETGILKENKKEEFEMEQTGFLYEQGQTESLEEVKEEIDIRGHVKKKEIVMLNEIIFIHTEEIIE